jgi:putative FmdB family regulatory protein
MPLYAYQCDACGQRFEALVRPNRTPEPTACKHCGQPDIRKVPAAFATAHSELDALRSLDPMYKRIVEDQMAKTPEAEPMRHLAKMTPFDVVDDPGKPIDF